MKAKVESRKAKVTVRRQPSVVLAAALALILSGCAATPSAPPAAIEQFEHSGLQWTRYADGTITSNNGHTGRTDPRIPLCSDTTLSRREGKAHAVECRVR